jgi:hypothetical protein
MNQHRPASDLLAHQRTRIAFLGTTGSLGRDGVGRELERLRGLVEAIEPDLLGVEAAPADWETADPGVIPAEISHALVAGARFWDTVVIPLGGPSPEELAPPSDGGLAELRARLIRAADSVIVTVGRRLEDPGWASRGPYGHLCGAMCHIQAAAASERGVRAWARTNEQILDRLMDAVRRDPGTRFLVAVRCRRIHHLRARVLALTDEVDIVPIEALARGRHRPSPFPTAGLPRRRQRGA